MKDRKVLLIGNECNNGFSISRYLNDMGYETHLLLFGNELNHMLPESDLLVRKRPGNIQVTTLTHFVTDFFYTKKKYIHSLVKDYDFIIGNGASPAYLNLINIDLDLFIPFGSDLYYLPFYKGKFFFNQSFKKKIKIVYLTYHQKKGIKRAKNIMFSDTNSDFEKLLIKLNVNKKRNKITPPILYHKEYEKNKLVDYYENNPSEYSIKFEKIRQSSEFMIFHHCRHSWKTNRNYLDYKGNEKLLKGFSQFLKKNKTINSNLILFEYGQDVEASKTLIKKLNIGESTHWFPVLERREIMYGISLCDLGVGELGMSWLAYSVLLEFLCMSKPIIATHEKNLYKKEQEELYKINHATNSNEVFLLLDKIYNDLHQQKSIVHKNFNWFQKKAVNEGLDFIIDLIEKK